VPVQHNEQVHKNALLSIINDSILLLASEYEGTDTTQGWAILRRPQGIVVVVTEREGIAPSSEVGIAPLIRRYQVFDWK